MGDTWFRPQTDRQMDKVQPVYLPFNFVKAVYVAITTLPYSFFGPRNVLQAHFDENTFFQWNAFQNVICD